MARTPVNYAHNLQLATSAVTIVSAAQASETKMVRKLSFYNSGTATRTVTVHIVESAGSAGTANILDKKGIPGGKSWNVVIPQGENLVSGMTLQATQDVGTDVNVNCSGSLVT